MCLCLCEMHVVMLWLHITKYKVHRVSRQSNKNSILENNLLVKEFHRVPKETKYFTTNCFTQISNSEFSQTTVY